MASTLTLLAGKIPDAEVHAEQLDRMGLSCDTLRLIVRQVDGLSFMPTNPTAEQLIANINDDVDIEAKGFPFALKAEAIEILEKLTNWQANLLVSVSQQYLKC